MSKAKRWPTNAEWARLDALAKSGKIINLLRPVRDECEHLTTLELVRRTGQAIDELSEIVLILRAVGPQAEKEA